MDGGSRSTEAGEHGESEDKAAHGLAPRTRERQIITLIRYFLGVNETRVSSVALHRLRRSGRERRCRDEEIPGLVAHLRLAEGVAVA